MASILYKGKTTIIADECVYGGDGHILEFQFENNLDNTSPNSWALPGLSPSLMGSATYSTTAKNGSHSLSLPGNTSSYVKCLSNNTSPLNLGNEDFTFEMWFRLASNASFPCTLFSRHSNSGGYAYMMILSNLTDLVWAKNEGYIYSLGYNIVFDTWHHIAVVKSNGIRKIYFDGNNIPSATQIDNTPYNAVSTPLEIGRNGDVAWAFNGLIDDFRFYKRAEYTANFTPV